MESKDRLKLVLWILIPVLVLVLLPVSAQPGQVAQSFANLQLAIQQNRPQDQSRELETLLSLEPWRTDLWEDLGAARQATGNLDQAIEAYQKALFAGKLSVDGQFALGDAFSLSARPEQAKETWAALLHLPLNEDQYLRLYENQSQHGEPAAVLDVLSQWTEKFPENGDAFFYKGLYLSLQQPADAIRSLQTAAQFEPDYNTSVSLLLPVLRQAARAEDVAYRQVMVGRGLGQAGQWALAQRAFDEAVLLQPGWAEAWAFLGEARQHNHGDAWPALQTAQQLDPHSVIVSALVALYWRRQGDVEQALPQLQAAAEAEPEQVIWQIELGNAYSQAGELGRALTHFQNACDLEPENPLVWEALAAFSANYGIDINGIGLPAARQAVLLAPQDPFALDLMGWILLSTGDLDSAERFLQQSLKQAPNFAAAHLHMGQIYLERNDNDLARTHLSEAERLGDAETIASFARRLLDQIH